MLADKVGVDAFGIGEHHRDDFAVTAPEVVLAAIASRTERIKLGTAVTVLSSDDPIRVYERFATLDAVSKGRAEITLGRGSFTESFPLFGYDLSDYERLFEEKLELFAAVRKEKPFSWQGTTRAPLEDADVFPKTESGSLTTWIGVGGSPESVVRAARYGFGLDARDHRRRPRALRPLRRPVPAGALGARLARAADRRPLARLRRRYRRGGPGAALPHFKAQRDRIGARTGLAADEPRPVRLRGRGRRRLRRLAGNRRREDRPHRASARPRADSTSSTATAPCPTSTSCTRSSSTAPRSFRALALCSPARNLARHLV